MKNKISKIFKAIKLTATVVIVFLAGWQVLLGQTSTTDLFQAFSSLPVSVQQQLISQFTGQIGSATSLTPTPTPGSSTEGGLPLGQDAIDYVRTNSPAVQVNAARAGHPTSSGTMFTQPTDEPDFCDRVKEVFLTSLIQAFANITGISLLTPTPTPTPTGTLTPTPTPTSTPTPTPTP